MSTAESVASPGPDRPAHQSALFVGLVLQHANLASICLGRAPNPETGKTEINLEAATVFIDTLEMLQVKTRGNLSDEEARLLTDTLTHLRLEFVEAAQSAGTSSETTPSAEKSPPTDAGSVSGGAGAAADSPTAGEESRKKFVKRY